MAKEGRGWLDAASSVPSVFAHFEAQGMRPTMEDAVIMKPNFPSRRQALYAVLDGHGGGECSADAQQNWPPVFSQMLGSRQDKNSIHSAFHTSFTQYDANFLKQAGMIGCDAGSTAVSVFYDGKGYIHCANIGDSRAVLCRKGGVARELSVDHKADRPDELTRIENAGGYVSCRRALGTLAVSRALGDGDLKRRVLGAVIADPEIQTVRLQTGDEFILIACDGLFDVMSSQEAVNFVRSHLFNESNPKHLTMQTRMQAVCRALVNHAINVRFSTDNVSVVLVGFEHNSSGSGIPSGYSAQGQGQSMQRQAQQQPESQREGTFNSKPSSLSSRDSSARVKTSRRQHGSHGSRGAASRRNGSAASRFRSRPEMRTQILHSKREGSENRDMNAVAGSNRNSNSNSNSNSNASNKLVLTKGGGRRSSHSAFSFGSKTAASTAGSSSRPQSNSNSNSSIDRFASSSVVPHRVQKQQRMKASIKANMKASMKARTSRIRSAPTGGSSSASSAGVAAGMGTLPPPPQVQTQRAAGAVNGKINHGDSIAAKNAAMAAHERQQRDLVESYKARLRAAIGGGGEVVDIGPSVSLPSI